VIFPGAVLKADGTVDITASSGQVADFINEGIGFMNDGSVAIDTGAPAGNNWKAGFRLNASGAIYGTVTTTGLLYIEGVRISDLGALVYAVALPQDYVNGNPIRTTGVLATS
jgi:hypothetical protein